VPFFAILRTNYQLLTKKCLLDFCSNIVFQHPRDLSPIDQGDITILDHGLAEESRRSVQTRTKLRLIRVAGIGFLFLAVVAVFFSFVGWFMVPGPTGTNRFIVAGLFTSVAINALLTSGILFARSQNAESTFKSLRIAPAFLVSGLLVLTFVVIAVTAPWWAAH